MEAEAYDAAAALKVKEGNALARIVASQARKSGTSLVRKDMRRVSGDKQKLKIERATSPSWWAKQDKRCARRKPGLSRSLRLQLW